MKQITLCLALAALLLAGCTHNNHQLSPRALSGERCYLLTYDEPMGPWGNTMGLKKSYAVAWPAKGSISDAAERELLQLCFADSTSANIGKAAKAWLAKPYIYADDGVAQHVETVNTLDESHEFCYVNVESSVKCDSALATFLVKTESYGMGAHGLYTADYLTVDLASGNAVHIEDLVADTNQLCEAVARAIQDLEVNRDVRECLYDEYRDADRMPLPRNFVIDSARNGITVVYGLYEIQPYACGIPSVELPIFWLSKHVGLTPYAKRLFGPGSYLPDDKVLRGILVPAMRKPPHDVPLHQGAMCLYISSDVPLHQGAM